MIRSSSSSSSMSSYFDGNRGKIEMYENNNGIEKHKVLANLTPRQFFAVDSLILTRRRRRNRRLKKRKKRTYKKK